MRKIILAINNKKIEDKIFNNIDNKNIELNILQYREAILEMLGKEKEVDSIFINESLPGIISIEELIKKIKIINNKVNLFLFLEKEDINKKNKLKKLGINNIYLIKKINIKNIINLLNNNLINNKKIKNKINYFNKNKIKYFFSKIKINKIINYKKLKIIKNKENNNKKNKIITVEGKRKSGKTTLINLLLIYLLQKNKKILLINLNKKIENNYFYLFKKYFYKKKNNYFKINNNFVKNNIFYNSEIKIKNNLIFLNNFNEIIKENNYYDILEYFYNYYIKNFDYVLVDVGDTASSKIRNNLVKKSDKELVVINDKRLGVQDIADLSNKIDNNKKDKEKSLHIVLNKYYLNSISKAIFRNLLKNKITFLIFFYNRELKKIPTKIKYNKKIKLSLLLKINLNNIINK